MIQLSAYQKNPLFIFNLGMSTNGWQMSTQPTKKEHHHSGMLTGSSGMAMVNVAKPLHYHLCYGVIVDGTVVRWFLIM